MSIASGASIREGTVSESNKTAAAIMAAEAARQKRALDAAMSARSAVGYDIAGDLWAFYEEFLRRLEQRDGR